MDQAGNARVVNIHEAKTTLSRLIERVLLGEEIMIAKNNVPIVKLVALDAPPAARVLGALAGKIHVLASFDDDAELVADFEGSDADPLAPRRYPATAQAGVRRVAEPKPARRPRRP